VSDAIRISFQKYVTGSPVGSQGREDDFENYDRSIAAVKVRCSTGTTENPPNAALKTRGPTKLTQHMRAKADEFVYRMGQVKRRTNFPYTRGDDRTEHKHNNRRYYIICRTN
jgi:hypothetical protein